MNAPQPAYAPAASLLPGTARRWRRYLAALYILAFCALLVLAGGIVMHRFGSFGYLLFKISHPDDATGWSQGRIELLDTIRGRDEAAVVFLGDSLTHQAEWSELLRNPWVRNRGVDGETTDQILARLPGVIAMRPAAIFIMAGINDLAARRPEAVFANIRRMVQAIREGSPRTRIVLQSVLPVNNAVKYRARRNADVRALNGMIGAYARESGVAFLDLYPRLSDAQGDLDARYTYDGIHLSGAGYERWLEALRSVIP